ncbi:MAG: cob(I)yrinic acid a,c-diamide adenosyltransferase [Acidimicrobiales bacterium]
MEIYTRKGDDGSTGLLYGGRVAKDSALPVAYGTVDEAQAVIGLARAETERDSELDRLLVGLERDLWVLMAELATDPVHHHKLVPGTSLVTPEMVTTLEAMIDDVMGRFEAPTEFVVPGQTRLAALLDVARTVTRRAERVSIPAATAGSQVLAYLNRLSDLLWALARWQDDGSLITRPDAGSHA